MAMPIDLVLVRHGESEGNVAHNSSKSGDHSYFTPEFLGRPSSKWRLTDRGQEQARLAGKWIRDNLGEHFDRYYVAEFLRAMETAAYLGLPGAVWYCDFYLRERDWGRLGVISYEERSKRFAEDMQRRELDSFFWTPPDGESMAALCLRIDRVLDTLHRECAGKRVIVVCHGEVMWGFRVRLERMPQERYHQLDTSTEPFNRIHNCQTLHYTRRQPGTDNVAPYMGWMRSVCPWDTSRSRNEWVPIERPRFSTEDLMAIVEKTPQIIK